MACFQPDFRIAVTGSVVELDKAVTVMKKLKLQGMPYKIYKNTAFIQVQTMAIDAFVVDTVDVI